jgi:hypothetical protein
MCSYLLKFLFKQKIPLVCRASVSVLRRVGEGGGILAAFHADETPTTSKP